MITIDISSLEISAGNHLLAITARSILNKETSTDIKFEGNCIIVMYVFLPVCTVSNFISQFCLKCLVQNYKY